MMDDPLVLGRQHQLGNYKATYNGRRGYKPWPAFDAGSIIGVVGLLLTLPFLLALSNYPLFFIPLLVFDVFLLLMLGYLVYRRDASFLFEHRVFLYDSGLIYRGHESSPPTIIRWQDVQEVWYVMRGDEGGIYHRYTMSCGVDGPSLTLNSLSVMNMEQLGEVIEEETGRYLFDAAYRTYQTGQDAVFGFLTVTFLGLYYGDDLLPWSEMKSIEFGGATLVIRKQGKLSDFLPMPAWARIERADIPNVQVFRELIRRIKPEVLGESPSFIPPPRKTHAAASRRRRLRRLQYP